MIRYRKGPAPPALVALQATPGTTWDGLGADDRGPLRAALVRDQAGLCAYCQRRITADLDRDTGKPRMKIEHWVARSDPDRGDAQQLAWSNLLGVCPGGDESGSRERHCDASRGARPLFLNPVEGQGPDPREYLAYTRNGEVSYRRPLPPDRDDLAALQLNAARLRRGRQAIFDEVWRRLERDQFSLAALHRIVRQHEISAGSTAPEHAEFVRYHVLKKLRQREASGQ